MRGSQAVIVERNHEPAWKHQALAAAGAGEFWPAVLESRGALQQKRDPLGSPLEFHVTFQLRDATPTDIPALAALHVQTFNDTHREGLSGGPSYELREQQWRDSFKTGSPTVFCVVLAEDQGGLVGFVTGTRHDGGVPGFIGELNKIYLLRRVQRRGLGRLLLCAAAERFRDTGIHSMLLFGDASSRANGFYEAFGAERLYAANGAFHGGYGWRDLALLMAQCRRAHADD